MSHALKSDLFPLVSQASISHKRKKGWLPIMAVALGLLVIAVAVLVFVNLNTSTAAKTLDAFCNGLKKSDYHTAYAQFSLGYRHKISERNAVNRWVSTGTASCTYSIQKEGERTSAIINYQNVIGVIEIDQATLIKGNNDIWRIDALKSKQQNLQA